MRYNPIRLLLFFLFSGSAHIVAQEVIQLTDNIEKDLSSEPRQMTAYGDGMLLRIDNGNIMYYDLEGSAIALTNELTGNLLSAGLESNDTGLNAILFNEAIYFKAIDYEVGAGIWVFNGSETNLVVPMQLDDYDEGYEVGPRIVFENKLYVMSSPDPSIGVELYSIDQSNNVILIEDFTTGSDGTWISDLTVVQDELLLIPDQGISTGLWKYKTEGKLELIQTFDNAASYILPRNLTPLGDDAVVVEVNDVAHGAELWIYDGTDVQLITDLNVGNAGAGIDHLIEYNGKLYFEAIGPFGRQLYSTDGTAIGTDVVKVVDPSGNTYIDHIVEVDGLLYFDDSSDIWVTDGTEANTTLWTSIIGLKHMHSTGPNLLIFTATKIFFGNVNKSIATEIPNPPEFQLASEIHTTQVGTTTYFNAQEESIGEELWQVNGDFEMTLAINLETRTEGIEDRYIEHEGYLYYLQECVLWRTDGTASSAMPYHTFSESLSLLVLLTPIGDDIYLAAKNNESSGSKSYVIFKHNTTDGQTTMIDSTSDLIYRPFVETGQDIIYIVTGGELLEVSISGDSIRYTETRNEFEFFNWNGDIYHTYEAPNHPNRYQLFKNGELLYNFGNGGTTEGKPENFTASVGALYFTVDHPTYGREIWKTDGNTAGTSILLDYTLGSEGTNFRGDMIILDDAIVFGYYDNPNFQIASINTSSLITSLIKSGVQMYSAIAFSGYIYFTGYDHPYFNLWRTDGTEAGTLSLTLSNSAPKDKIVVGDFLYFELDDGLNGSELWRIGSGDVGLEWIRDIYPGRESSSPDQLKEYKGTLSFLAETEETDTELFVLSTCQGSIDISCDILECELLGSILRSDMGINISGAQNVPINNHVTMVAAEGLTTAAELTIDNGATLSVSIEGCQN